MQAIVKKCCEAKISILVGVISCEHPTNKVWYVIFVSEGKYACSGGLPSVQSLDPNGITPLAKSEAVHEHTPPFEVMIASY